MAIGAKVVDVRTGLSPSVKQSVVRYVCYFISAIALGLVFFVVARSDKKQG
jgi:bacteriorhodopsin